MRSPMQGTTYFCDKKATFIYKKWHVPGVPVFAL